MGWGAGRLTGWNARTKRIEPRTVGYTMLVFCDVPGCLKVIDRGLGYRCGGNADDISRPLDTVEAWGCGAYTCADHMGNHDCPELEDWCYERDADRFACYANGHEADDDTVADLDELEWGDPEPACPVCAAEAAA